MDFLAGLMSGSMVASTPAPDHDFWYQPVGTHTTAGLRLDAEGAQKLSAWFRGRELLATALGMLPLPVYQRLSNEAGAEVARNHPLYDVLHDAPHEGLDSFTWRREAMYDLIDHGWAYAWLIAGPRGFADQLLPIDAELVRPEKITSGPKKGRWLFHVRDDVTGRTTVHTQDEIFYLRGAEGKGILARARESLGTALATESYAAGIFGRGALNGGVVETPGAIDKEAMGTFARSFLTKPGDWHVPKILPLGATFKQNTITPEDAQMLLSRKFSVTDIARWLGLPPHMLADLERATFSNIEHQGQEFVTYSLGPWLSLWEFAINQQLMLARRFYAEFTREALVRGDIATRWEAHVKAVNAGIKTPNEARAVEGLKKMPGGDTLREPKNITGSQSFSNSERTVNSRAQAIATESAGRLLRKEIKAVQQLAVRYASNQDEFAAAVTEFYASHHRLVMETLQMSDAQAAIYCSGQAAHVLGEEGLRALETWEQPHYAAGLASWALEGEVAA